MDTLHLIKLIHPSVLSEIIQDLGHHIISVEKLTYIRDIREEMVDLIVLVVKISRTITVMDILRDRAEIVVSGQTNIMEGDIVLFRDALPSKPVSVSVDHLKILVVVPENIELMNDLVLKDRFIPGKEKPVKLPQSHRKMYKVSSRSDISSLKAGDKNIQIQGRVIGVIPTKMVDTARGQVSITKLQVKDHTGEININLWGDYSRHADNVDDENVRISGLGISFSRYSQSLEATFGTYSKFEIIKNKIDKTQIIMCRVTSLVRDGKLKISPHQTLEVREFEVEINSITSRVVMISPIDESLIIPGESLRMANVSAKRSEGDYEYDLMYSSKSVIL